ncbi:hypothetical protein D3C72_1065090 [compost metagenome]
MDGLVATSSVLIDQRGVAIVKARRAADIQGRCIGAIERILVSSGDDTIAHAAIDLMPNIAKLGALLGHVNGGVPPYFGKTCRTRTACCDGLPKMKIP